MKNAEIISSTVRIGPRAIRRTDSQAKARPAPRDRGFLRLAHQHILGKIQSADVPAGTPLSELALAAELGLSRTPVREAIGHLVAEGILQKTSRGAVVAEPTRQDIIELYEMREAMEVFVIGKVAGRRLSAREMEALQPLVEEMRVIAADLKKSGKPVLRGEALKKFVTCDLRFHMLLIQAGDNERMLKLLDSTHLLLRVFTLRREHHTVKLLGEVYEFHRRILDAVAAGAREDAVRLLGEHIRLSRDERLAEYEDLRQIGQVW